MAETMGCVQQCLPTKGRAWAEKLMFYGLTYG